jgi:hypothetical protein
VLSVGKTFVIFVFCLFHSLCSLYYSNIIFTRTMLIYIIGDFDAISSIGYYHVFALNIRDSHIFILNPMRTGIVDKEDRMKRFSHALK